MAQGEDGQTQTGKGEGVNDPQRYREAAIRHMPALLTALPIHVLNCTTPDCGMCLWWEAVLVSRSEQAEQRRTDEATYQRQVAHEQNEERKDAL